jgi:hypothetical protein
VILFQVFKKRKDNLLMAMATRLRASRREEVSIQGNALQQLILPQKNSL